MLFNQLQLLARKSQYKKLKSYFLKADKNNAEYFKALYFVFELLLNEDIKASKYEEKIMVDEIFQKSLDKEIIAIFLRARYFENIENFDDAEKNLHICLKLNSSFKPAIQRLANLKLKIGSWKEAESLLRSEISLDPNQAHLLSNLSVALMRQNKLEDALKYAYESLKYADIGQKASAHVNIGSILQELSDLENAELNYRKALSIDSKSINAKLNIGVIHLQKKQLDKAEKYFRDVLEEDKQNSIAQTNLAGTLFLLNKPIEGWHYYEKRLTGKTKVLEIPKRLSHWTGGGLNGDLLLIHEQGLGDTFHFIRYAEILRRKQIRCFFFGPAKLHSILKSSNIVVDCFEEANQIPSTVKSWTAVTSLPAILDSSSLYPLTNGHPYLRANPESRKKWEDILGEHKKIRVALHWQGNPSYEFSISRGRSFELDILTPLLQVKNIEWISLQKGPGSEQCNASNFRNAWHPSQDLINNTWDFSETAALLECCDLLISSDSGLAHLAGALGKPVWLILPWLPEWRWGMTGDRTKWYKHHVLFRKSQANNWEPTIIKILEKLLKLQAETDGI